MNTGKILDIAPRWSPDWQPAAQRPGRDGPPDTKPVEPATATAATTDLVRRHAEAELRAQSARSEAAQREAAEQAARDKARAAAAKAEPQLARRVGLVDGSFDVYVDLLEPVTDRRVFRLFGPNPDAAPAPAAPPASAAPPPAIASQAYTAGGDAPLPGRALATEA